MPNPLVILDTLPSAADFYGLYWNRHPFVVRAAIPDTAMADLITADQLAGLALEDAPQSRMVTTGGDHRDWSCRFGPFSEHDFEAAGDADWALLVQNVEQFHPDTATLLRYFNVAPRWLMDDIMVSYSTRGGTVGPHIDSYHVFLVQGQGKRRWKVGRKVIKNGAFIQGLDLKILRDNFAGDNIEVTCGDVLYIPPKFGHESTTLENALTFSIGFLGPKMSELFSAYGQHLSENETLDQLYVGDGLGDASAGFTIAAAAVDTLRDSLSRSLDSSDFSRWLVAYFTEGSHEDFGGYDEREDMLDAPAFEAKLKQGASLIKPEYVKFALTASSSGDFCLGFDGRSVPLDERLLPVIRILMKEQALNPASYPGLLDHPATLKFLLGLYNHQVLELRHSVIPAVTVPSL